MQFGLFCEIPVARPWGERSEWEAYQQTLEAAVLADRVGFHSFWTVEHHFLEEFSHCSAPGVLYGAVAAKTRNLRIGHGVRLLPFPYNHPVRAAEAAPGTLWTHDEGDQAAAFLLSQIWAPEYPIPIGILLRRQGMPSYEEQLLAQEERAVADRGPGDIAKLLLSGETWKIG